MVFTIVTIIFLPMSFIAAFFAINFKDWGDGLTIAYVCKYMFGIGLAISFVFVAMAFLVPDISDTRKALFRGAKSYSGCLPRGAKQPPGEDDEGQLDNLSTWTARATKPGTAGTGAAASTSAYYWAAEEMNWKRRGLESPEAYSRMSRERERYDHARLGLSPMRYGARKLSIGSGNGAWTRPSVDGRRGRLSEDLERGRDLPRLR